MPSSHLLRIAFIGAGSVNFGSTDLGAPWDHASRIEALSREFQLEVVAVSDPDQERIRFVLEQRRSGSEPSIWATTASYADYREMLEQTRPDAVFIGVPPFCHGELEIACASAGAHMFIEKPIHCGKPSEVHHIRDWIARERPDLVVSIGYMLRYSKAVDYVKRVLAERQVTPASVMARYNSAYSAIPKKMFWDERACGGPVIEQGTHFADLARYFCGDADLGSVHSICVRSTHSAGQLTAIPEGVEDGVDIEYRIARASHATWRIKESGGIATLSHAILGHGTKYHTEFEIWCDGLRVLLHNPYTSSCYVVVNDEEPVYFPEDDFYLTEDRVFLQAVVSGDRSEIRSTYEDAVKTHELTYALARSSAS